MAIKTWQPKGNFETLGKRHRKNLISQTFENTENPEETVDWTLFMGDKNSALIFALTKELGVIAIKQFRFGSFRIETEVVGGNVEEGESEEEAAKRELEEETGFRPQKMVRLMRNSVLWVDTATYYKGYSYPWLALDCIKVSNQKLDQNEDIDVEIIPLGKWIEMIKKGIVSDCKTIAMTYLAVLNLKM